MKRLVATVVIFSAGCATAEHSYRRSLADWHVEQTAPTTFTVRYWVRPGQQTPTSHAEEIPAQEAESACFDRVWTSVGRPKEHRDFVDSVSQCMLSQGWELRVGPLVITS